VASIAHQQRFIVTFEGMDTREKAEHWRGVVLSAPRLDDESVIWIDQLYDAEVYDADGVRRGVVVGVEANPASDLLVLDSGALVPLTFVTTVEANVRIEVDVPKDSSNDVARRRADLFPTPLRTMRRRRCSVVRVSAACGKSICTTCATPRRRAPQRR